MSTMELWDRVSKTNPAHTKNVSQRGGFTAINAQSQLMEATRVFGPFGAAWSLDDLVWGEVRAVNGELEELTLDAVFRFPGGAFPMAGSSAWRKGDDTRKKLRTDVLTKCLSNLGFNADVFLGQWDDNKYVATRRAEVKAESERPDPWADPNWAGKVDLTSFIPSGSCKGMPWAACRESELPMLRKMADHGEDKGLPYWLAHASRMIVAIQEAEAALGDLTPDDKAKLEAAHAKDEAVCIETKPPQDRKTHYADRSKARLKQLVKFISPRAVSSDHSGDIAKLTIGTGTKLAAWINEQWGEAVINPDSFKEWWAAVSHEHLTTIKGFLVDAGADVE